MNKEHDSAWTNPPERKDTTDFSAFINKESESQSLGFVLLNERHIRYDIFVEKLFKRQDPALEMYHAVLGICGEAGELGDAIKKHLAYGRELDIRNVIEELGDLRFYMQALMNLVGVSEQQILQHNALKLAQRYEGLEYSDEAAQARADKQGEA